MTQPRIALLVGSLSAQSINQRLARAIVNAARGKLDIVPAEIGSLPLYNRDFDRDLPPSVVTLKARIAESDGILIVTPEHNRTLPSVLKNAIDWASRPYGKSAWKGKVAAIAGGSSGAIGTAVAQSHLRIALGHLDVLTLAQPELHVRVTDALIDAEGTVHDPQFQALLETFVERFAALITSATA